MMYADKKTFDEAQRMGETLHEILQQERETIKRLCEEKKSLMPLHVYIQILLQEAIGVGKNAIGHKETMELVLLASLDPNLIVEAAKSIVIGAIELDERKNGKK